MKFTTVSASLLALLVSVSAVPVQEGESHLVARQAANAAALQTSLSKSKDYPHLTQCSRVRGAALDPSQVQPGLALDGQAIPEAGQVPSLTSNNNLSVCHPFA